MSHAQAVESLPPLLANQPCDVRNLAHSDRDALIVSMVKVDGQWQIVSRYGADRWELTGRTTNRKISESTIDFKLVPESFRTSMKGIMYRYLRRGRRGKNVQEQVHSANFSMVPCRSSGT